MLSRIGETSLGEVRKALCFATGTSTRDGDVEVENAEDDGHVVELRLFALGNTGSFHY